LKKGTTVVMHHFCVFTIVVSSRIFFIDMRHRIASVLFFGSPVLLVNFR